MFSKALFKQSCKANGTMWGVITFAVCFMLACVMLISGNGNIGEVKNSIQDTIIVKEIDAQLDSRALYYYDRATAGLAEFDRLFGENSADTLTYLMWCANMPAQTSFTDTAAYAAAVQTWRSAEPQPQTAAGREFAASVREWMAATPVAASFETTEAYLTALNTWEAASPATQEAAVGAAYNAAAESLKTWVCNTAETAGYTAGSDEEQELLGCVMYALNPGGMFNDFYTENGEDTPEDYDILSVVSHIISGDSEAYLASDERADYIGERAAECSAVFLAGNMTKPESVETLTEALSSYGVTAEKYDSFGYTYGSIKHRAGTTTAAYRGRLDYELASLAAAREDGDYANDEEYTAAVAAKKEALAADISASFLSTLPTAVSDALEEIGKADLYTLIVGSIFYKLAGLLLPIIYMIMASNNLIAGQVDSGSMAYVLSTSTKRGTVVFTQAVYLIGSLFAMFGLTTATGCICLSMVSEDVELTYKNLILLNIGAFLVLFALSGLCHFTSCVFDRSRRSMAIGGGLSIFALVAAMLGLFGSPVIPSVVRLEALNNFNYATIISLFDVISIIDGTNTFIWKFAILAAAGVVGYIAGSWRFVKKDLPL